MCRNSCVFFSISLFLFSLISLSILSNALYARDLCASSLMTGFERATANLDQENRARRFEGKFPESVQPFMDNLTRKINSKPIHSNQVQSAEEQMRILNRIFDLPPPLGARIDPQFVAHSIFTQVVLAYAASWYAEQPESLLRTAFARENLQALLFEGHRQGTLNYPLVWSYAEKIFFDVSMTPRSDSTRRTDLEYLSQNERGFFEDKFTRLALTDGQSRVAQLTDEFLPPNLPPGLAQLYKPASLDGPVRAINIHLKRFYFLGVVADARGNFQVSLGVPGSMIYIGEMTFSNTHQAFILKRNFYQIQLIPDPQIENIWTIHFSQEDGNQVRHVTFNSLQPIP